MTPIVSYRVFIKNAKNKIQARGQIKKIILTKKLNVSQAARLLSTSRPTVRKLLNTEDLDYEKNKAPLSCPHKTSPIHAALALYYNQAHGYGASLIKVNFTLPCCTQTIQRILKSHDCTVQVKRRYIKQKEVRSIRFRLKAFEKWQLDTKYLTDIPNLVYPIKAGLSPKYEYTLRDVYTGTTFLGYAHHEKSLSDILSFTSLALAHMQLHGIDTHYVNIQCDNGTENLGNFYQHKKYELQKLVESYGARFNTIPIASPTWNSHVESFHGRVEPELYDRIQINSSQDFMKEAQQFVNRWNWIRKSLKYKKTPAKHASEQGHHLPKCFYNFPILVYDQLQLPIFSPQGGKYLPIDTSL